MHTLWLLAIIFQTGTGWSEFQCEFCTEAGVPPLNQKKMVSKVPATFMPQMFWSIRSRCSVVRVHPSWDPRQFLRWQNACQPKNMKTHHSSQTLSAWESEPIWNPERKWHPGCHLRWHHSGCHFRGGAVPWENAHRLVSGKWRSVCTVFCHTLCWR